MRGRGAEESLEKQTGSPVVQGCATSFSLIEGSVHTGEECESVH